METDPDKLVSSYSEAFAKLSQAINIEHARSRIRIHPYVIILTGTAKYVEKGGKLTAEERKSIDSYSKEARLRFGSDLEIRSAVELLDSLLE